MVGFVVLKLIFEGIVCVFRMGFDLRLRIWFWRGEKVERSRIIGSRVGVWLLGRKCVI